MSICIYVCLVHLVIKSYKLLISCCVYKVMFVRVLEFCCVQCYAFAQSPRGRCLNDKYPLNTSHRSDLCKNVSLHCYLVATVIHIQSLHSQICVYIHVLFTAERLVGEKKYKN